MKNKAVLLNLLILPSLLQNLPQRRFCLFFVDVNPEPSISQKETVGVADCLFFV